MLSNFLQAHATTENTSLVEMVQRWIREGWTGLEITGELELWQDHYGVMIEHLKQGADFTRYKALWNLASQLQDFMSKNALYGRIRPQKEAYPASLWSILMAEWPCPNPENIYCVEIPEEIEIWENWELWRFDPDVFWPSEPDISNPPPLFY